MGALFPSLLLVGCVDYAIQDPDDELEGTVAIEERFVQAALPELDVLFVVDSTGSMEDEQIALAGAAAAFVDVLDALDLSYQLGVTTTDPEDEGSLVGRPWIITGEAEDPADALASAIEVGFDSAPPAAGLYTATLALADEGGLNRGFRRDGAGLHVVFLSDGDDESDAWLGEDPAEAFLTTLAADAAGTGRAARASAVVGDLPDGCRGDSGEAQAGTRYAWVAGTSGGVVASICDADFAEVAVALGDAAVEWPTRFALEAVPVDGTVLVEVEGARVDSGWSIDVSDEPALVFDAAPAPDAEIHIAYRAIEEGA